QLAEHLGDGSLSDREVEVLSHVAAGNRNRDIEKTPVYRGGNAARHYQSLTTRVGKFGHGFRRGRRTDDGADALRVSTRHGLRGCERYGLENRHRASTRRCWSG